jgi:hypothetical protein
VRAARSELVGRRRCPSAEDIIDPLMRQRPLLTEGLTNRLETRHRFRDSALVSCLTARWTPASAASGQDVPDQEGDDDDRRCDGDDGDGGGGYDHAAILASLSGVETRRLGGSPALGRAPATVPLHHKVGVRLNALQASEATRSGAKPYSFIRTHGQGLISVIGPRHRLQATQAPMVRRSVASAIDLERGQQRMRSPIFGADVTTATNHRPRKAGKMERLWKTRGQRGANASSLSSSETASTSQISLTPAATGCPKVAR